jgi:hypothetical protein
LPSESIVFNLRITVGNSRLGHLDRLTAKDSVFSRGIIVPYFYAGFSRDTILRGSIDTFQIIVLFLTYGYVGTSRSNGCIASPETWVRPAFVEMLGRKSLECQDKSVFVHTFLRFLVEIVGCDGLQLIK